MKSAYNIFHEGQANACATVIADEARRTGTQISLYYRGALTANIWLDCAQVTPELEVLLKQTANADKAKEADHA